MAMGTFVEGKVIDNGTGTATTAAFTNAFATGQLVAVMAAFDGSANTITSVTDSKGNTYVQVPGMSVTNGLNPGCGLDMWYAVVTAGGAAPTVTVNYNATGTNANVAVQYFNGFVGTPTLDKVHSQINASSTTATSGATAATTQAVELVIGLAAHAATTSAFTLGAGYTNLSTNNIALRANAMESLVTAATGAQTATFTIAAARVNAGGVATFYDAVAGGANNGAAFLSMLGA